MLHGAAVDVRVDDAQLRRVVVALRVLAPNAIRPIEERVPLLYPGVKVSYGTIQGMLIEAELRPCLYVHKGVTRGFLALFRVWFNLRTRRWGRHKRTSAHQCLTGQRVHDWLTLLGYPPSPALT